MIDISKWVQYETRIGEPMRVGGVTVTPQSAVLTIRWPNGAWIWHHPLAVTIEGDDFIHRQPIVDITRQMQWMLIGVAILFTISGWRTADGRQPQTNDQ